MGRRELVRIGSEFPVSLIPDQNPGVCLEVYGIPARFVYGFIQEPFEFLGLATVSDVGRDNNSSPKSGVFFEYPFLNPYFNHFSLILSYDSTFVPYHRNEKRSSKTGPLFLH
jgi:hypothetical protein